MIRLPLKNYRIKNTVLHYRIQNRYRSMPWIFPRIRYSKFGIWYSSIFPFNIRYFHSHSTFIDVLTFDVSLGFSMLDIRCLIFLMDIRYSMFPFDIPIQYSIFRKSIQCSIFPAWIISIDKILETRCLIFNIQYSHSICEVRYFDIQLFIFHISYSQNSYVRLWSTVDISYFPFVFYLSIRYSTFRISHFIFYQKFFSICTVVDIRYVSHFINCISAVFDLLIVTFQIVDTMTKYAVRNN